MDEILEEEKKPSQPKHTALFVTSTIAIFIVALLLLFVWSINFKEIVDSADQGGELNGLAIFFAAIFLALPFLVASVLTVIISAVFAPLALVKLRKSSSKAFSIVGLVYGIAFIVAVIATVVRAVLFFSGIQ